MTAGSSDSWQIVELTTGQTHPLRLDVLRHDTPSKVVSFPEDGWPGTRHLGVIDDGTLVGTSTWIPRPFDGLPEVAAVQLRGMATAHSHQGRGVGLALLEAGCAHALAGEAEWVWANARDTALGFYIAHGFAVVGDGFLDASTTQMPHHVVVRHLI